MLGQRSGRIILGNPEAGNATVIRMLQQPKGGAGYCDSLDILLQWNSAPFTAGDAIPLSIQIKGAGLVIRAFLSRFEIPRPRPSSKQSANAVADSSIVNRVGTQPPTNSPFVYAFKAFPWEVAKKGSQKKKQQEARTSQITSRSDESDSRTFASRFNHLRYPSTRRISLSNIKYNLEKDTKSFVLLGR